MGGNTSVPEESISPERTFIVTGGNTGIGYETAKKIAQLGGRVIIACRSEERAQNAIQKMKADTEREFQKSKKKKNKENEKPRLSKLFGYPNNLRSRRVWINEGTYATPEEVPGLNVQFMHLDLSSLESTREFANRFKETGLPLHVLICNAGLSVATKTLTDDGFELHFQVNYLSHFLLTLLLLPLLKQSVPNSRIINVSSLAHDFPNVEFDLTNIQAQKNFTGVRFYGNSKLFQVMNMYSLSRHIEGSGVSIFSLNPGLVKTEINRHQATCVRGCLCCLELLFWINAKDGSRTSLIAALDPKYNDQTALYFSDSKLKTSSSLSRDTVKQEILWKYSLQCLRSELSDVILQEIGEKLDDIQPLSNAKDVREPHDIEGH